VENIQVLGNPERILPALLDSERAMPNNYIASLRLAQMESAAKHSDEAIAACDRGLARGPGPNGRAWLLQIKATTLIAQGQKEQARRALEEALRAAQAIPDKKARDMNVKNISNRLQGTQREKN
jgi:predicted negative regulator of RcsB-dependent stress response